MNTQSLPEHRDALFKTLAQLEAAVESPCVPGELERWIDAVEIAFQRLRARLSWQISEIHAQQLGMIADEDEELLGRVEQMRRADTDIAERADQLAGQISKLKTAAANVEPNEAKLRSAFDEFVTTALELVIRVRTQEQAIRTWLMEAFTRDRGNVD